MVGHDISLGLELPPRARRIHRPVAAPGHGRGTTSACAENTILHAPFDWAIGNYLRVRGEYSLCGFDHSILPELPPRARRILFKMVRCDFHIGTTSACAENTISPCHRRCRDWNYLRVRGEYLLKAAEVGGGGELPPRARRIPHNLIDNQLRLGTTSACAENTISAI